MKPIVIGTAGGKNVTVDVDVLLRTRLLIQANSGGGKSWLLRRIAEQLFGKVPTIIIDPEGEFATLREKYGFVLVGKGGETTADCRSAAKVAHTLLELRASAVCDIYEMKPFERHRWVKTFLEALVDAPKSLWGATVIIVDEAHTFCPEGKAGESESSSAMVDLTTRGRKRGFCAVFATQRLGKLRKDASAELLNRLVGPTFEDIDLERASDLLSVSSSERRQFFADMRVLEPGNFFAIGRAVCKERTLVTVGDVVTTHPEIGSSKFSDAPPPTPEQVKRWLPKLADLPQAAEKQAKTEADLRQEIRSLKAQLVSRPVETKTTEVVKPVEVPVLVDTELRHIKLTLNNFAAVKILVDEAAPILQKIESELSKFTVQTGKNHNHWTTPAAAEKCVLPEKPSVGLAQKLYRQMNVAPARVVETADEETVTGPLPKGERAVLVAVAQYPDGLEPEQITVLTGYKRSSRDAYLTRLLARGFVARRSRTITATQEGIAALGDFELLPTGEALRDYWIQRLGNNHECAVLKCAIEVYPNGASKEQIDEQVGCKRSSRDAYIVRLKAKQLIRTEDGLVFASDNLF